MELPDNQNQRRVVPCEYYQRVSNGVGLELVDAAREMSYAKASRVVTSGLVTKQTVMRKIREAAPAAEAVVRRKVPVLHADADEDHVKLQTGDRRIVPLISAYEGIERNGKRGVCKNVFHCSEFGRKRRSNGTPCEPCAVLQIEQSPCGLECQNTEAVCTHTGGGRVYTYPAANVNDTQKPPRINRFRASCHFRAAPPEWRLYFG